MRIERQARVLCCAQGAVRLQLDPDCNGCTGCGGRCSLLAGRELLSADEVVLPESSFSTPPTPGQGVLLSLSSHALLDQALRGYGGPLVGLLAGAACGQTAGDGGAALGALVGTLLMLRLSQRGSTAALQVSSVLPVSRRRHAQ